MFDVTCVGILVAGMVEGTAVSWNIESSGSVYQRKGITEGEMI